jgi:hypothetical protein
MKKIIPTIACCLCLGACNEPGNLPGHLALEAIHVEKGKGPPEVTVAISTTTNLVAEIQKLDSVTYGYLSCPLGEKAFFDPKEDAGPALHAPVHERWLPKNGGTPSTPGQKYRYQLAGRFESADTDNTGKPLPITQVINLLKKHATLSCKIVILRYFRAPYFSNTALLKTDDLIMALEKVRQ